MSNGERKMEGNRSSQRGEREERRERGEREKVALLNKLLHQVCEEREREIHRERVFSVCTYTLL